MKDKAMIEHARETLLKDWDAAKVNEIQMLSEKYDLCMNTEICI